MRIFEVALLVIVTSLPFLGSGNFTSKRKRAVLIAIGIIFAAHVLVEGMRWQMFPGYVLVLMSMLLVFYNINIFKWSLLRKVILSLLFLVMLLVSWILPVVLPVFELPAPMGEYQVGAQQVLVNTGRPELITADAEDQRGFMVKVWYPAVLNGEEQESYLDPGNRLGFSSKYGLPDFETNYLDYVETHTLASAKVAAGKFPVLIFSHGYNSDAYGYSALLEEIVSHGFIVLNINHTYESTGSQFPSGEIKLFDSAFSLKNNSEEMSSMIWESTEKLKKAQSDEEEFEAVENLIRNYAAAEIGERWSLDFSSLIDELADWDRNSFLEGHMDLDKVGAFGHSQGGSAVGQAMIKDNRIDAGMNLDGAQWGTVIDSVLQKPFASIASDWDADHPDLNKHAYRNGSTSAFFDVKIKDSGHSNFMDIILLVNLRMINQAGKIDAYEGYKTVSDLVVAFFDRYLNGADLDFMKIATEMKKVEVRVR